MPINVLGVTVRSALQQLECGEAEAVDSVIRAAPIAAATHLLDEKAGSGTGFRHGSAPVMETYPRTVPRHTILRGGMK